MKAQPPNTDSKTEQKPSTSWRRVDVRGDGNCGYYAYGVGLMAYLRHHSDQADSVFEILKMDNSEKKTLKLLLIKNSTDFFSKQHIRTIEKIFGPKLRNLLADYIFQKYTEKNTDKKDLFMFSDLQTMVRTIITEKLNDSSDLKQKAIAKNTASAITDDYKKSEVNCATQSHKKIKQYLDNSFEFPDESLMEQHILGLANNLVANNPENFLADLTDYLKTPKKWASQAALVTLDRAINERLTDNEIKFQFTGNTGKEFKLADIVLTNENSRHWTANIPGKYNKNPERKNSSSCVEYYKNILDKNYLTDNSLTETLQQLAESCDQLDTAIKTLTSSDTKERLNVIVTNIHSLFATFAITGEFHEFQKEELGWTVEANNEMIKTLNSQEEWKEFYTILSSIALSFTLIGLFVGLGQAIYSGGNHYLFWSHQSNIFKSNEFCKDFMEKLDSTAAATLESTTAVTASA